MSIESLRLINQRLKPMHQKIHQLLRFGQVVRVSTEGLDVAFSELEIAKNIPFLAINGLQMNPKSGDSVLIYSPQGRQEQAVVIAVVTMGQPGADNDVRLNGGAQTLGDILHEISTAIQKMSSPGFFTSPSGPVNPTGAPITISTQGFK